MNSCAIQSTGAIELYFYGEITGAERRDLEAHLADCLDCRHALDELQTIRVVLAARPAVAAPPGADWTRLMARITAAVASEVEAGHPPMVWRRPSRAYLAIAATLALLVAGGGYLARYRPVMPPAPRVVSTEVRPAAGDTEAAPAGTSSGASRDAAFAAVSEHHFERSKLVILGLASRNAETSSSADWAYERRLAGPLLEDTRLYKQAAEARGLGALARVMSDLELVLLQASLSDQQDATTLDRLQRLIHKRDLVSKMETTAF